MTRLIDKITEIEDAMEEYANEVYNDLKQLNGFYQTLANTEKPLTVASMTSLFTKTESIRIGIFELAKPEEYYSINILFRSLLEHFTKAQFIWMKTLGQKDDQIGIDFWVFGQDQENINFVKSIQSAYELIEVEPQKQPIDILKDIGVITGEKSGVIIKKRMDQFIFKKMVEYINNQINSDKGTDLPFLGSLIPWYSQLSSSVHGGPTSNDAYSKGPIELDTIIGVSAFASLYVRWLSFILFYQFDENLKQLCIVTKNYLDKLNRYL